MTKKRNGSHETEEIRTASANGCTGLMPTPAEEEEERLAYSEIETLQTDETMRERRIKKER